MTGIYGGVGPGVQGFGAGRLDLVPVAGPVRNLPCSSYIQRAAMGRWQVGIKAFEGAQSRTTGRWQSSTAVESCSTGPVKALSPYQILQSWHPWFFATP